MYSALYASIYVLDAIDCNMPCVCENNDLIAKLNESNRLVEKYKNLAKHFLQKLKEF